MKNISRISLMALFGLALIIVTASAAFAAGTNAGDSISNQATLTYEVGTVTRSATSDNDDDATNGINATLLTVDNRVDLTMTGGNKTVIPASTSQILVFTVENTGNEDQGYDLDLFAGSGAEDQFDMSNVRVYLDADKSGTVNGTEAVYNTAGLINIADVPANAGANSTIQILVVADTPAVATDGQTAAYTLKANTLNAGTNVQTTATAGANTALSVDVVLADNDAGAGVGGSSDGSTNGDFLATGTYTVQAASIAVKKEVAVISDPINGATNPKAIPGAILRYTITVTNSGASAASNVVLTDPIPTFTDFMVGTVVTGGTVAYDDVITDFAYSPSADGDGKDADVTHIRVTIASIAGGGSAIITFNVRIE